MTRTKPTWGELSPTQQRAYIVAGAIEAVLTAVALRDLAHRPAEQVRGSKTLWALGCAVQPVGPLVYLWWGRRA